MNLIIKIFYRGWLNIFIDTNTRTKLGFKTFSSKRGREKGPYRVRTGDLLICSQMLYHWAKDPSCLQFDTQYIIINIDQFSFSLKKDAICNHGCTRKWLFWWLLEKVNYFCFKLNFYLFLDWIVTMIAIINFKK